MCALRLASVWWSGGQKTRVNARRLFSVEENIKFVDLDERFYVLSVNGA